MPTTAVKLDNLLSSDHTLTLEWTITSTDYKSVSSGLIRYIDETSKIASQVVLSDAEIEGGFYVIRPLENGHIYTVSLFYIEGRYDGEVKQAINSPMTGRPCTVPEAPVLSSKQSKSTRVGNFKSELTIKLGSDNGAPISRINISRFCLNRSRYLSDINWEAGSGSVMGSLVVNNGEVTVINEDYAIDDVHLLSCSAFNDAGPSHISNTISVNYGVRNVKPQPFSMTSFQPTPTITLNDNLLLNKGTVSTVSMYGIGTAPVITKSIGDFTSDGRGGFSYKFNRFDADIPNELREVRIRYNGVANEESELSEPVPCIYCDIPGTVSDGGKLTVQLAGSDDDSDDDSRDDSDPPHSGENNYSVIFTMAPMIGGGILRRYTMWNAAFKINGNTVSTEKKFFGAVEGQDITSRTVDKELQLSAGDVLTVEYSSETTIPSGILATLNYSTSSTFKSPTSSVVYRVGGVASYPSISSLSPFTLKSSNSSTNEYGVTMDLDSPVDIKSWNKPTSFEAQLYSLETGKYTSVEGTVGGVTIVKIGINVLMFKVNFVNYARYRIRVRSVNVNAPTHHGGWSPLSDVVTIGILPTIPSPLLTVSDTRLTPEKNLKVGLSWPAPASVKDVKFEGNTLVKEVNGVTTTLLVDSDKFTFSDETDKSFIGSNITYYISTTSRLLIGDSVSSKPSKATVFFGAVPMITKPTVVEMRETDRIVFKVKDNSLKKLKSIFIVAIPAAQSPPNADPLVNVSVNAPDADGYSSYDVDLFFKLGPEQSFMILATNDYGTDVYKNHL